MMSFMVTNFVLSFPIRCLGVGSGIDLYQFLKNFPLSLVISLSDQPYFHIFSKLVFYIDIFASTSDSWDCKDSKSSYPAFGYVLLET